MGLSEQSERRGDGVAELRFNTQSPGFPDAHTHQSGPIHIDCGDCTMRDIACGDCVVSVLLGRPPTDWEDEEQRAIGVLAESGLVPPLRLVRGYR